jgi:hypothetical protein
MRPLLLSFLLSPLFRTSLSAISTRKALLPTLEYPVCRRNFNFTCATPLKQDFRTIMTDLDQELFDSALPCEGEVLGKNEGREEALKEIEKEEKKEEPKLPKLSAADFRAYNSMAEHMEYFVGFQFLFHTGRKELI